MSVPESKTITAIVGPTGVGKTAAALRLADHQDIEIISADSRQVYRGMDIGTGKETHLGHWQDIDGRPTLIINNTPIHGLDLVNPSQPFSIADWHAHITTIIDQVYQRQHRPVIVGGTGFYLQALQGKVDTISIPPQPQLRQQLGLLPAAQLFDRLNQLKPAVAQALNYSDKHNPARLIRLIEIHQHQSSNQTPPKFSGSAFQLHMVGLTLPRPQLYVNSDSRTDQMIEQGLVNEVQQLINQYGHHQPAFKTIGYSQIIQHLQGQLTLDQAIRDIKFRNHHYIRRQYTWFNKQPVLWIDKSGPDWLGQLSQAIRIGPSSS